MVGVGGSPTGTEGGRISKPLTIVTITSHHYFGSRCFAKQNTLSFSGKTPLIQDLIPDQVPKQNTKSPGKRS